MPPKFHWNATEMPLKTSVSNATLLQAESNEWYSDLHLINEGRKEGNEWKDNKAIHPVKSNPSLLYLLIWLLAKLLHCIERNGEFYTFPCHKKIPPELLSRYSFLLFIDFTCMNYNTCDAHTFYMIDIMINEDIDIDNGCRLRIMSITNVLCLFPLRDRIFSYIGKFHQTIRWLTL